MKGDFSRIRFNPKRHYTSVLEQQGRVSLDADANEQRAIDEFIRRTENDDIIGKYGAPKHDAGFEITLPATATGLQIGPGRYYVNGLLCENEAVLDYAHQPYFLNPPSQTQLFRDLRSGKFSAVEVFLEVWQRMVTALDDSCLREPALGQADTTTRLQTVWRVIAEGVLASSTAPGPSTGPRFGPGRFGRQILVSDRLASTTTFSPSTFTRAATPASVAGSAAASAAAASSTGASSTGASPATTEAPGASAVPMPGGAQLSKCCVGMYDSITERTNLGKLTAQTTGQSGDCTCQPTPAAGYRGLENQLYRVEIHTGGDEKTATFKWSRENGSVVVGITDVSGSDVVVDTLGPDANLGFQAGQWVEVSDDTFLFGVVPNQPGELYQITKTTPEQLTLTMDRTVAAVDKTRNAGLRRWEQFGAAASAGGVPLSAGTWIDLENGIQVKFAAGQYLPGDYWLIPARTASGQIDWPPCDSDGSDSQPPKSTHVYRAPLACMHVGEKRQLTIDDCRLFFLPLTELGAAQVAPALHINTINWLNDEFLTLDQLAVTGLRVTLDAPLTGNIDASTFIVSLEVPAPGSAFFERAFTTGGAVMLRTPFVLDGVVTYTGNDVLWQVPLQGDYTLYVVDQMLLPGASVGAWTRARVKLVGRDIFNVTGATRAFLDGRSYGINGLRHDGKTPRIDLQLPSGNSEKASDFESWFYLAPALGITSFQIQPPAVKLVQDSLGRVIIADVNDKGNPPTPVIPTGTITLNYPPLTDTVVVNLSVVSGSGTPGILNIPNTVTVKAGQPSSQPFQIGVANPGSSTQNYQVSALINLAGTLTATNFAPFSVTGFGTFRFPVVFEGVATLKDAVSKVAEVVKDTGAATTGPGVKAAFTEGAVSTPVTAEQPLATKESAATTTSTAAKEAVTEKVASTPITAEQPVATKEPAATTTSTAAKEAVTEKVPSTPVTAEQPAATTETQGTTATKSSPATKRAATKKPKNG